MIAVYVANECPVIKYYPIGYHCNNPKREKNYWEMAPKGEKLGEFETKQQAFQAMNQFATSVQHLVDPESQGLVYTEIRCRPDGLFVSYFDDGVNKNHYCMFNPSCIEFVLINSEAGAPS